MLEMIGHFFATSTNYAQSEIRTDLSRLFACILQIDAVIIEDYVAFHAFYRLYSD